MEDQREERYSRKSHLHENIDLLLRNLKCLLVNVHNKFGLAKVQYCSFYERTYF